MQCVVAAVMPPCRLRQSTLEPLNPICPVSTSLEACWQAGSVDVLLSRWRSRVVVLVNAEWSAAGALTERAAVLAASFEVVYCFEPIAVRVRAQAPPGL